MIINFMEEILEKKEELEKLKIKRVLLNEKQIEKYDLKNANAVSDKFYNLHIFYALYENGRYTTITEEIMKEKGLRKEDVRKIAEKSADSRACTLDNVIMSAFCGMDIKNIKFLKNDELNELTNDFAYVIADTMPHFGASVILDTDFLKSLSDRLDESNLCILPSSVHEAIVVPVPENINYDILIKQCKEMVKSVNETLDPMDILSEDVYIYNYYDNNISLYNQ